jgi:hypothetical protein
MHPLRPAILAACLVISASCTNPAVIVVNNNNGMAAAGAHDAGPQQTATLVRDVASGKTWGIGYYYDITPQCANAGYPTVKVTKNPDHGKIDIENVERHPTFAPSNIRSPCNALKLPATGIAYTSEPGFTGRDTVTLDVVTVDGQFYHHDYVINVN